MSPGTKKLKRHYRALRRRGSNEHLSLKQWAVMIGDCWHADPHPLQHNAYVWCLRKGTSIGQAVS